MNPILSREYFIPDAEAHKMPDGRLYLYGSSDISGEKEYCSHEYHVFSTDDPTLSEWRDHGVSFQNTVRAAGVPWNPGTRLYAPDTIHKDGKYYLYFCGSNALEGVAVSDRPEGPFDNAVPIEGADGDGIDPAVFVDDDGQAYYLWGQFSLRGAKLDETMTRLVPGSITRDILTEHEHGFHEGASLRKRNGKYYIVYTDISRGKATCISYAVSDSPLGPYKKGGVIIDNMYCDPGTWNNHGSIEEYKGQWYVFYHRSSQNSKTSRRVCAEKIFFDEDGQIHEVEMTSQGASGPINAFSMLDASAACRMKGNVRIVPDKDAACGCEILDSCGGGSWTDDWAEYRYIDFKAGAGECSVRARGKGKIRVRAEGITGDIAVFSVSSEDQFVLVSQKLSAPVDGVRAVWLFFDGEDMAVDFFKFR